MFKSGILSLVFALTALSFMGCSHPVTGSAGVDGTGGVSSNLGGGANAGTGETCPTGQVECSLGCADLTSNPANCGQCDMACGAAKICVASLCVCQGSLQDCSGSCLDVSTDNAHCGDCTTQCGAGQTCSNGRCVCGTSGQVACSGTCTDIQTDPNNCGSCGYKCQSGQTCSDGNCLCQGTLVDCGGTCVDTQSDNSYCGGCTTSCSGATPNCSLGQCSSSCGAGETPCPTGCPDLNTSLTNCGSCGNVCGANQTCTSGQCVCTDTTKQVCSGICVNVQNDANNCGICDHACPSGQSCSAGVCGCPAEQKLCGTQCVTLGTDLNCSDCGDACTGGEACSGGACSCTTAGETFCNGACIDVQSDPANCGFCANKCNAGATCSAGQCSGGQSSCGDQTYSDAYTPGYDDTNYHSVAVAQVNSMSVTDKLAQMQGTAWGNSTTQNWTDIFRSADTATVRGFWFRDGPRGVNLDASLKNGTTGGKATVFPVSIARGAAFDLDLEYRIGEAIGDEGLAAQQTMILAPTVNILRHPFWGRAQETYGEDAYLLGRMGSAFTVGVQKYIAACVKHFAANNIENGRATANAQVDEQTLHEVYGSAYEMIIKDGGVACVMAAYNLVNSSNCTQNAHLLTDILRNDFGFKGFVLTDWWAMPGGSNARTSDANTLKSRAAEAVNAGLDMELPWNLYFSQLQSIIDADSGAKVTTAQINTAATRILEQKLRFKADSLNGPWGLATPTTTYSSPDITNNQSHIDLAYEAAVKSMVLLKNADATLPINRSTVKKIAVIGATVPYTVSQGSTDTITNGQVNFVSDIRTGDVGSSRVNATAGGIGPLAGIEAAAGSSIGVISGSSASAVTSDTDFVIVMAGLTAQDEGEEYTGAGDRNSCNLDDKQSAGTQNALIASVAALGKPMVVVLEGGSVINVEPWYDSVPAIVMAWYPGMVGGKALGSLLFADATGITDSAGTVPGNFSGKLPITWPKDCVADEPTFSGGTTTTMAYDIGYRYFDRNGITPRFPFGFGLSYTTFAYSNLITPCSDVTKNGIIDLKVTVQNTGTVAGTETVFAFAQYPNSSAHRSVKELKGFARVTLEAGQSKQVGIQIRASDLKYWDSNSSAWVVETGNVEFDVGPSAAGPFQAVTIPVQ